MPEEINRLLADSISDLLFCSEQSGVENLRHEGVSEEKIHLAGNLMIDSLLHHRKKAEESRILDELQVPEKGFAVATLHRPSNVDSPAVLEKIISVLRTIGKDMPVIFPIHPRTRQRIADMDRSGLKIIDPLGYLDFLKLISSANLILTDSGGIQEETTILEVPCLTLGENTERPCTVEVGSNRLVGTDPARILDVYRETQNGGRKIGVAPPMWDGSATERVVTLLENADGR